MKQIKLTKMKKIMLASVLIVLTIFICGFAIISNAETAAELKATEDEKTLVKTVTSISRATDANNVVNLDAVTELLNKYAGRGVVSATEESSDTLSVSFSGSGREYEVNLNNGPTIVGAAADSISAPEGGSGIEIELPNTEYSTPYLPEGFTPVNGTDLNTGLVIQDSLGNQYVWVEVPRTSTVYGSVSLNITEFTDTDYTDIENALKTYTSVYRNGTSYTDTWNSSAQHGFASADEYNALKNKMLKSVYENGGFYVGRYEAGTFTARASEDDTLTTPVIKANAYPYNFVTCNQAQTLASTEFATGGYTTSLMFGVQWDLMLKYLETKGVSQTVLNSDSTEIGNYYKNMYNITEESAKYYSSSWLSAPYNKTEESKILLTTGASSEFSRQNISDFAGNVEEFTLEYTSAMASCATRGCNYSWGTQPASYRTHSYTSHSKIEIGFRVALY